MTELIKQQQAAMSVFAPQNLEQAIMLAERYAQTDMVPKDYRGKPDNILVAWQMAAELGLAPMQGLQNIAVIGGRPAIWGDAMLALVKMHPDFVDCIESTTGNGDDYIARCCVKRRDREDVTRTFSVADVRAARLQEKDSPWKTYPKRMMQMRARGFALRDSFPDALKGFKSVEEVRDEVEVKGEIVPRETSDLAAADSSDPIVNAVRRSRSDAVKQALRKQQDPTLDESESKPFSGDLSEDAQSSSLNERASDAAASAAGERES